jgi:hypothetical protein
LKKDEKLRFLSFRLDFNEYYSQKKNNYASDFDDLKKYGIGVGGAYGNVENFNF